MSDLPMYGFAVTKSDDGTENGYGATWDGMEANRFGDAMPLLHRTRGAIQRAQITRPIRFRLGAEEEWCASGVVSADWLEHDDDPVYASLIQWAEYEYGCADVYFRTEDLAAEGIGSGVASELSGFSQIYG